MENDGTRTSFTLNFWLAAFILAWTVDLLFWGQSGGISFVIWIALGIGGLFAAAWWEHKRPSLPGYLLVIVCLVLASTLFLRSEPFSIFITGFLAVVTLGLLAATFTTGNWPFYRIGDFLLSGLKLVAAGLIRAGQSLMHKPAPDAAPSGNIAWNSFRRTGLPLMRGAFLALPVVAILAALLASADPVFGRYLGNLLKVFDIDRLPEYIFRFSYVLIFTYVFTGVLLYAIFPEPVEKRPDPHQPWKMRFLGSTEAAVILGSVVFLFAIFVALQVRYLFGGQANINETGFTYADYARRGFFELVWVALLSLGLFIGLGTVTRRETSSQDRGFTLLTIGLLSLVLVILASAFQRLLLYENAYGFTRLRTYTHIFIPWLAILLLVAIILQAVRRPGHLGVTILVVTLGFGITFTAINVDALIARLNLQRARSGQELDPNLLVSLSSDAVPTLARAYQDSTEYSAQHDQIGAVLACHMATLPQPGDWRSFRLSENRAAAVLAGLDLSSYPVVDEDTNAYVMLNSGPLYCRQASWD